MERRDELIFARLCYVLYTIHSWALSVESGKRNTGGTICHGGNDVSGPQIRTKNALKQGNRQNQTNSHLSVLPLGGQFEYSSRCRIMLPPFYTCTKSVKWVDKTIKRNVFVTTLSLFWRCPHTITVERPSESDRLSVPLINSSDSHRRVCCWLQHSNSGKKSFDSIRFSLPNWFFSIRFDSPIW